MSKLCLLLVGTVCAVIVGCEHEPEAPAAPKQSQPAPNSAASAAILDYLKDRADAPASVSIASLTEIPRAQIEKQDEDGLKSLRYQLSTPTGELSPENARILQEDERSIARVHQQLQLPKYSSLSWFKVIWREAPKGIGLVRHEDVFIVFRGKVFKTLEAAAPEVYQ